MIWCSVEVLEEGTMHNSTAIKDNVMVMVYGEREGEDEGEGDGDGVSGRVRNDIV
jgi:hypothetical protein